MKSTVRLEDNIFDIFGYINLDIDIFEQTGRHDYKQKINKRTPVEDREYVSIFLRADDSVVLYKREYDDILTYMGDLGGLLDILLVCGYILTSLFASKLFLAALMRQAYRIQSYTKDFTQYYQTHELGKLTT